MSDDRDYMREYMRLKRAAKKVGLAHLPIGEIKELASTGELTNTEEVTASSETTFSNGHQSRDTNTVEAPPALAPSVFDKIPLWVYGLVILGFVVFMVYGPSTMVNRAVQSSQNEQDNKAPGY